MIPVSIGPAGFWTRNRWPVFAHAERGKSRKVGEVWRKYDGSWTAYVTGHGVDIRVSTSTLDGALFASGWSRLLSIGAPRGCCETWVLHCVKTCRDNNGSELATTPTLT